MENYSIFLSLWMCKSRLICLINPLYNIFARLGNGKAQGQSFKDLGKCHKNIQPEIKSDLAGLKTSGPVNFCSN